jgi:hypothetical protein
LLIVLSECCNVKLSRWKETVGDDVFFFEVGLHVLLGHFDGVVLNFQVFLDSFNHLTDLCPVLKIRVVYFDSIDTVLLGFVRVESELCLRVL